MESLSRLSPFADFFWSMMVYVSLGKFVSHFSSYGMLWHAMACYGMLWHAMAAAVTR